MTATTADPADRLRNWRVLWQWTSHDFSGRYGRGFLRAGWAVLQPLFAVAVYVVVFGVIFDADTGDVPYLTFLLSGMVVFRMFGFAVSASTCLSDDLPTLRHLPIRKEVVPIAQVLASTVDMAIVFVVFVATSLVQGADLRPTVVLAPLVLVPAFLLATGVCTAVATAQVFVPDVRFASTVIAQLLFFASPITYHPDDLPTWLTWLEWANPISVFMAAFRDLALGGVLDWPILLVQSAVAVVFLAAAVAHLGAIEHRISDLG